MIFICGAGAASFPCARSFCGESDYVNEPGDEDEPGIWAFQYNTNGAMTRKAFTPTGATAPTKTWTYGWNRQNRLSTVHYNSAHIASYAYDPFGRRIRKSVHSSITGGTTGTTYYLYNDTGLVAEYTQTGQLNTEYHYVPGSNWSTNPLFARDGQTGEIHYVGDQYLELFIPGSFRRNGVTSEFLYSGD